MKKFWELTREQQTQVDRDPKVAAACAVASRIAAAIAAATAAATAAAAVRATALDEAYDAYIMARDEAMARLFGKEEPK